MWGAGTRRESAKSATCGDAIDELVGHYSVKGVAGVRRHTSTSTTTAPFPFSRGPTENQMTK